MTINDNNAQPVFSIIIPAYNQGWLLKKALESVLRQEFDNYEVIIIDDGSTDNTREIVNSFQDVRIKYYYQNNSRLAIARNTGIKHAKGKYVAFLDADDIWYSEKLKKCYEIIMKNPDKDLICHNEIMKDISGRIIRNLFYGPYETGMFRRLLFKGNCLSPSATVVKKDVLVDVGMFRENPEFFSVEDYDLWLRLSKEYKFYFIPEILGEYIIHGKNMSLDIERQANHEVEVVKQNFKEYKEKRILDFYLISLRISKINFSITIHFIRRGDIKKALYYSIKNISCIFSLLFGDN
ncbi:MAG: glycosyltransferase [Candidatus Omnitrophica bacterium]|nr:glycosyltransferase [Candidatus Omnitrophota bacterium]MDD5352654.1 glycosyltransferase [Candidatus Omnitrophota bacterium]MDD5550253.1 glycosyltransferase [Candidatus Omnitrophota bacterium]